MKLTVNNDSKEILLAAERDGEVWKAEDHGPVARLAVLEKEQS